MLVAPERLGLLLAAPGDAGVRDDVLAELARVVRRRGARRPRRSTCAAGAPTRGRCGYVTHWRPGDVMAVGPRHGTHEPPFYVCGSDQWVAGYMEGAVRTGRAAAAAALGERAAAGV